MVDQRGYREKEIFTLHLFSVSFIFYISMYALSNLVLLLAKSQTTCGRHDRMQTVDMRVSSTMEVFRAELPVQGKE